MHKYFIKTPWLVKRLFSSYTWSLPSDDKAVYLTFDDGPHPEITRWVLDQLQEHHAQATFFCVGNNVQQYPDIYKQILNSGHAVGNHTYHHVNGWENDDKIYLEDISKAARLIDSNLFRPPYGRIRNSQASKLSQALQRNESRVIMWDILSADFDTSISAEQCLYNVLENVSAGSIIVFHDSVKAWKNLEYVLPKTLAFLNEKGFVCEKLD